MKHPTGKTMDCPECSKQLMFVGVMLFGNVLTNAPAAPVGRWDCPHCEVMVADEDIDPQWGWQQWERQNSKQLKK
jgi:ribosomal protein L37AE/L43A